MRTIRAVVFYAALLLLLVIPLNYVYFLHLSSDNHVATTNKEPLKQTVPLNVTRRLKRLEKLLEIKETQLGALREETRSRKEKRSTFQTKEADSAVKEELARTKLQLAASLRSSYVTNMSRADYDKLEELHVKFNREIDILQNPVDCATAKYFVCQTKGTACGFGCIIHRYVWCFSRAIEDNRVMVLDPPVIPKYGRTCDSVYYNKHGGAKWSCYFQDISRCSAWFEQNSGHRDVDKVENKYDTRKKTHGDYLPEYLQELPKLNPRYKDAWYLGHLAAWLLRPSPKTKRLYDSSDLIRPYDFAIHVRRTDKLNAEALKYSLNEYMIHVDNFLHPERIYHGHYGEKYGKTVYVATDDNELHKEFTRFPQYEMIANVQVAQQASKATGSYPDGLEGVLLDLKALTMAKYFVGTLSSQLSRLVMEINYGNGIHDIHHRLMSLDEDYYCIK